VDKPKTLEYTDASDMEKLDSWLFQMQRAFEQGELPEDDPTRVQLAKWSMDENLNRWWALQVTGNKLARDLEWADLESALRAQFIPAAQRAKYESEMMKVSQKSGESISAYFLRVMQLWARVNGGLDDTTVMKGVLDRMRKDEWPYAHSKARQAVHSGEVKTLATLQALMMTEEGNEPKWHRPAQPQQQQQQRTGAPPTKRVAALQGGDEEEEEVNIAPVGTSDAATKSCFRCKKKGHLAAQCTEADTRKCHTCKQTGHLARKCPTGAPKNP
jgi:hypothetical protein